MRRRKEKSNMKKCNYDAVIIGFGKGGKTLAGKLATAGKRVALIEADSKMYGGTCINVGCIPSKSLVVSAAHAPDGWDEQCAYYRRAIEEKRRLTAMLRQKNFDKLNQNPNVTIYNGTARFAAQMEVEVSCRDETLLLTAGQIFINTGAIPRIPPIPGLETTAGVYTSAGLMDLETLPKHLMILGGGYIGLEFASMFAAFGSRVTVVQDSAAFLPKEDEDIAAEIRSLLEAQGVTFCLGETPEQVVDGPTVVLRKGETTRRLSGDAVLIATGRIPNTAALNCEAAGVTLTARGAVQVDELLRTTTPNIWAMGDVAGGLQHTYVSLDDSRIVWGQLFGAGAYTAAKRKNVPYSVFLATPYSRVGLNEREARAAGYRVKIAKLPAAAIPKAQVLKAPHGLLKAVIDEESGKILGAMLLCEASHEMVNVLKLAIDFGADYTVLRDQIFTHPTMTESLNDLFSA